MLDNKICLDHLRVLIRSIWALLCPTVYCKVRSDADKGPRKPGGALLLPYAVWLGTAMLCWSCPESDWRVHGARSLRDRLQPGSKVTSACSAMSDKEV